MIYIAKEILKTPFRPLHILLANKVAQLDEESVTIPPRFLYKMMSFWQKNLKIHTDFSMSLDEKKCETTTVSLV